MTYADGTTVEVGDRVRLSDGMVGTVVCSLDTGRFSNRFSQSEWGFLRQGILVETVEAEIVHYPDADEVLVERVRS